MTRETLLAEWRKLSRAEQREVIAAADELLYDDDYEDPNLSQELKDFLDARLKACDAEDSGGMTLQEFKVHMDQFVKPLRSA